MKIGILTGGGDCPGLNPVIRAVTRSAINDNQEIIGFKYGWSGLIDKEFVSLNLDQVSGILPKGGTILGTSRTNPYKHDGGPQAVKDTYRELGLDGLVVV